ncbi:MAG: nucleotidyltransferase family protein [Muribaculaceae bacterium]|nr:nucleotidyltransferase family protein [Muribaculaceae bacterium]
MNAMIFAAGLGTRLAPLTDDCPKALLPVGGVTMLERAMTLLRDTVGVDRVVVNIHSHADMMRRWVADNAGRLDVEILISDESDCLLDTGGGLLKAAPLLDDGSGEPIMLYNADIVTDINPAAMLDAYMRSDADVTLLTADRHTSRKLLFDADDHMCGWVNTSTGEIKPQEIAGNTDGLTPLAFGGIHVVNPRIFTSLNEYAAQVGEVFSITPFYIARCASHRIMAWRQPDGTRWIDAGKPATYAEANRLWC